MTGTDEQLLERMERFPDRIIRLIEDESLEDLLRAGAGGSWGAVEHIAHLKDFDDVSLERIDQILQEDDPELELFDTDVRSIELDYHAQNPFGTAQAFRVARSKLVRRLAGLQPADWSRTANHPEVGRISLQQLVQQIDEHDAHHFDALREVLV